MFGKDKNSKRSKRSAEASSSSRPGESSSRSSAAEPRSPRRGQASTSRVQDRIEDGNPWYPDGSRRRYSDRSTEEQKDEIQRYQHDEALQRMQVAKLAEYEQIAGETEAEKRWHDDMATLTQATNLSQHPAYGRAGTGGQYPPPAYPPSVYAQATHEQAMYPTVPLTPQQQGYLGSAQPGQQPYPYAPSTTSQYDQLQQEYPVSAQLGQPAYPYGASTASQHGPLQHSSPLPARTFDYLPPKPPKAGTEQERDRTETPAPPTENQDGNTRPFIEFTSANYPAATGQEMGVLTAWAPYARLPNQDRFQNRPRNEAKARRADEAEDKRFIDSL